jgi:hypothetical protein
MHRDTLGWRRQRILGAVSPYMLAFVKSNTSSRDETALDRT